MKPKTSFKCLNCKKMCRSDCRNRGRQRYCSQPECRKASKAASQQKWVTQPANCGYFRGPDNVMRVQLWRTKHPGYSRRTKRKASPALQDPLTAQAIDDQSLEPSLARSALQDLCEPQVALVVGLIAAVTGHTLQDHIALSAQAFLIRGQDILRMKPGSPHPPYEDQTHSVPRTTSARASPV